MEKEHSMLALARHRKGWSQEKVAEAIGVTRSTFMSIASVTSIR